MATFPGNVALPAGAAGGVFCIKSGASITAGNGTHGTAVTCGTTGAYLAASAVAGRALRILHETTTVGSSVTEIKVYLYQADDANGTNAAAVSGASVTFTLGTPTAGQIFDGQILLDGLALNPAKYYGLAVTWKASAGTNNTGTGYVVGHKLDPVAVS